MSATWSPGIKDIDGAPVGDTVTNRPRIPAQQPLERDSGPCSRAYFAGSFPDSVRRSSRLFATPCKNCVLTTRPWHYEPESSVALGFGFSLRFSWACCTWRSCRSGLNENTDSTLSLRRQPSSFEILTHQGRCRIHRQPVPTAVGAERGRKFASRLSGRVCCCPPTTLGRGHPALCREAGRAEKTRVRRQPGVAGIRDCPWPRWCWTFSIG